MLKLIWHFIQFMLSLCVNNPIELIDTDGRKIVDAKGNVIYTHKTGWASNAPDDAIRLGNAMMLTQRGMTQFNNMVDAEHKITLSISSNSATTREGNSDVSLYGTTYKRINSKDEVLSVKIIIYEGSISSFCHIHFSNKIYKVFHGTFCT